MTICIWQILISIANVFIYLRITIFELYTSAGNLSSSATGTACTVTHLLIIGPPKQLTLPEPTLFTLVIKYCAWQPLVLPAMIHVCLQNCPAQPKVLPLLMPLTFLLAILSTTVNLHVLTPHTLPLKILSTTAFGILTVQFDLHFCWQYCPSRPLILALWTPHVLLLAILSNTAFRIGSINRLAFHLTILSITAFCTGSINSTCTTPDNIAIRSLWCRLQHVLTP